MPRQNQPFALLGYVACIDPLRSPHPVSETEVMAHWTLGQLCPTPASDGTEWPNLSLGTRSIHSRINHLQHHDWPLAVQQEDEYEARSFPRRERRVRFMVTQTEIEKTCGTRRTTQRRLG